MSSSFLTSGFAQGLVDRANKGAEGVLGSKSADNRLEPGHVTHYDHLHNIVWVKLVNGADDKSIPVIGITHYAGEKDGEGEIRSYAVGEPVYVQFAMGQATGLYNNGVLMGGRFTHQEHKVPMYAPWHQSGKGVAMKLPNGGASHTGTHTESHTRGATQANTDDWGHDYKVATGFNTTYSQKTTEEGREGIAAALAQLV